MDWKYTGKGNLEQGIHQATWQEVQAEFGFTNRRRILLRGMLEALYELRGAGCRRAFIDGSFATRKPEPGDFDAAWDSTGVDLHQLRQAAPELLDFTNRRAAMKSKYMGELFIADFPADPWGTIFLDFFQSDRDGDLKGIIEVDLTTLP
jgi:hypothetical protein